MKSPYTIVLALILTGLMAAAWSRTERETQPETMELVPMMQLLLADIYRIDEGVFTENYELLEEGARSIADHPVMTEEDKKMIQETLGEEFKKFVSYDIAVHHHADSMAAAAVNQDMAAVLNHYRIVRQGCVDCHADFRVRVTEARIARDGEKR